MNDVSRRDQLIDLLNRVKSMETIANRVQLVRQLKARLSAYSVKLRSGLPEIVIELEEYEQGWEVLLDAIDSLPEVFADGKVGVRDLRDYLVEQRRNDTVTQDVAKVFLDFPWPNGMPPGWEDSYFRTAGQDTTAESVNEGFTNILTNLGPRDVCAYVERLALLLPSPQRQELQATTKTIADIFRLADSVLADVRVEVATESEELRRHVLISIDFRRLEPIRVWTSWRPPINTTVPDGLRFGERCQVGNVLVEDPDDLKHVLPGLVTTLHNEANPVLRPPIFELMVDWDLIAEPFDRWPVGNENRTLGAVAPLVVRPLPTMGKELWDTHRELRHTRWANLPQGGMRQLYPVGDVWPNEEPDAQWVGLTLGPSDVQCQLAATGHQHGFPVGIWSRHNDNGSGVRGALNGQSLVSLPDHVFKRRRTGEDCGLVLLWDDPSWVLEGEALRWRSA